MFQVSRDRKFGLRERASSFLQVLFLSIYCLLLVKLTHYWRCLRTVCWGDRGRRVEKTAYWGAS